MMNITRNILTDTAYIRLAKGKVFKTVEVSPTIFNDIDKKGTLLGIELLEVSSQQDLFEGLVGVKVQNLNVPVTTEGADAQLIVI
jgi:uncharacterized protein YuzE